MIAVFQFAAMLALVAGSGSIAPVLAVPDSPAGLGAVRSESPYHAPAARALPNPFPWAQTPRADDWFGDDKLRHFLVSFAVTQYAYAGMRALGADRVAALASGLGVAAVAGVGKEVHDRRRGWGFSVRDLVWDAAGMAAAAALLRFTR